MGSACFKRGRSKIYEEIKQEDKFQLILHKVFPTKLFKHDKYFPRQWWVLCHQKYSTIGYISCTGKGLKDLVDGWSGRPVRLLVILVFSDFYTLSKMKKNQAYTEWLVMDSMTEKSESQVLKLGFESHCGVHSTPSPSM